jgi:cytochrome c
LRPAAAEVSGVEVTRACGRFGGARNFQREATASNRLALQEKTMAFRVVFAAGAFFLAFASLARADGDPRAGEAVFKKNCSVCHTTEDGKNKIGPSLHGVVGRHSASLSNFQYSEAMKSADKVWDPQNLDVYLTNPRALVAGTKMIFVGLKNEQDRPNIIAYLAAQK